MSDNKNEQVIVAFFDSKTAADDAINDLQAWDKANDEIKLGALGTLVKENGKVKTNVGRKTGKGAAVGTVVGIIAAILSGGLTLIGVVLVGGASGSIVGAFMKKSTNLTKAEIGERRWERLKVADANSDGKISLAELEQAKKSGKLHKGGRGQR